MKCSFCIIPSVRPTLSSRPVADVLAEARQLVGNGYRELVLTGIHLGHYGEERGDFGPVHLATLVRRLAALEGDFRLRLSSLEAAEVTPELVDLLAERPEKICPICTSPFKAGRIASWRAWGGVATAGRCSSGADRSGRSSTRLP